MADKKDKNNETLKKGLFGRLFEIRKEKTGSGCCHVELEEIQEEEKQSEEKDPHKT